MKKIILVCMLLVAIVFSLASCFGDYNSGTPNTPEDPSHTHSFGEWETVKEATALEDGVKKRVCSVCNAEETEIIEALGETPIASTITAAEFKVICEELAANKAAFLEGEFTIKVFQHDYYTFMLKNTEAEKKMYLCQGNDEVWWIKEDGKYFAIIPKNTEKYSIFTEEEFNTSFQQAVSSTKTNNNVIGNFEAVLAETIFDEATTIDLLKEGEKTTYTFIMDEQKGSIEVVNGLCTNLYAYDDEANEKILFLSYAYGDDVVFPEHPSLEELGYVPEDNENNGPENPNATTISAEEFRAIAQELVTNKTVFFEDEYIIKLADISNSDDYDSKTIIIKNTEDDKQLYINAWGAEGWFGKVGTQYVCINMTNNTYVIMTEEEFNSELESFAHNMENNQQGIYGKVEVGLLSATLSAEVLQEGEKTIYTYVDYSKFVIEVENGLVDKYAIYSIDGNIVRTISYEYGENVVFPEIPSLDELELVE